MDCTAQNQQLLQSTFIFILKIWLKLENRWLIINDKSFIMVYDNAPVHSNKAVTNFVSKLKLRTLSIPKYCSILNPAEKLINWIKAKLKSFQSWGRYIFRIYDKPRIEWSECRLWRWHLMKPQQLTQKNTSKQQIVNLKNK